MVYSIHKAQYTGLKRIKEIYAFARSFMTEHGNPTQWGASYPECEMLRQDILLGKLYVIQAEEQIHGVFYFAVEDDPTYHEIYNGAWHSEDAYGVIHRIAGDGSGGILAAAVAFGEQYVPYLRIDTHADNTVMQCAVAKQGFQYCGIIYVDDGTPRLAYDKRI